jgi:hypothetical protein
MHSKNPNPDLRAVEDILLAEGERIASPRAVFVLGAPRTGSTLLYQTTIAAFRLPFISNATNAWLAETPIVGIAIQNALRLQVGFKSAFGKTDGPLQPSEGSAVMAHWFGGGHPSQIVSARILDGREEHFLRTLAATEAICRAPLLIKNAWNCFRVDYLATALPHARFVWIRRDISDAALSDLEARYITKGDAYAWNSATPANMSELLKRAPIEQVVENQIAFNEAISTALSRNALGRSLEIWYEELAADPQGIAARLAEFLGLPQRRRLVAARIAAGRRSRPLAVDPAEATRLRNYVASDPERFAPYVHASEKLARDEDAAR